METNKKRDAEVFVLMGLVARALKIHNLEMGTEENKVLPLDQVICLDTCRDEQNIETYAVTKYSVIRWSDDEHIKFFTLDLDDIYTLQDIICDEYDLTL